MIFTSLCLLLKLKQHKGMTLELAKGQHGGSIYCKIISSETFKHSLLCLLGKNVYFVRLLQHLGRPPPRSSFADRGSPNQWSTALDLGSSLSGGVGSNPTAAVLKTSATQFQLEHVDSMSPPICLSVPRLPPKGRRLGKGRGFATLGSP